MRAIGVIFARAVNKTHSLTDRSKAKIHQIVHTNPNNAAIAGMSKSGQVLTAGASTSFQCTIYSQSLRRVDFHRELNTCP
jgi:hypothetical protein